MIRTKNHIDVLVEELLEAKMHQKLARMVTRERRKANREMTRVREILALPEPEDNTIEAETVEEAEEESSGETLSFRRKP